MTYYRWKDIKDKKREDRAPNPENIDRLERYLGVSKGLHLTSSTSGFMVSNTPNGQCFEWFSLFNGEWRSTHILFGNNWLFKP